MPVFNNVLAGAAGSGGDAGYTIQRSLRFNDNDSAHLTRTFSTPGNRKTWTASWWMKLGDVAGNRGLFGNPGNSNSAPQFFSYINGSGQLEAYEYDLVNGSHHYHFIKKTQAVFRDPSAWYHCVFQYDSTSGTAEEGFKIYVNGERITSWAVNTLGGYAQNYESAWNSTENSGVHKIGLCDWYFDGLLADFHFVDGQALTPTDFGELDATTGKWNPIEYTHGETAATSAITNVTSVDNTRTISVTAAGWQQLNNAVDSSDSSVSPSNNNTPGTITFSPALVGVTKVRAKTRFYGGGTAKLYNGSTQVHSVNHNNNNTTQYYTIYEGPPIEITQYWQQMNAHGASDDFWALEINNTIVATTSNGNNLITSISGAAITLTTTDNTNYSSFSTGDYVSNGAQISAIDSSTPSITVNSGSWSTGNSITAVNNSFHLDFSDTSSNASLGNDAAGSNNWTVNNISAADAVGSIYAEFNGSSNQYLRNNSGNVLPGSNGAFTIECHFYPHNNNVIGLFDGGSGQTNIIRNYGSNTIEDQGGGSVSFAGDYTQNAWNHIAVVYTGSTGTDTLHVYVNGVSSGSASGLNGFSPGSTFDIGTINGGGDGKFDGYIRNFRVTHAAVYTSNFTAPSHTVNLTALTDTKLLVITTPGNGLTGAGAGTSLTTSNNGSVSTGTLTAASQTDSFRDTPTDYDDGTNIGGNYATLNSVALRVNGGTISNGNLTLTSTGSYYIESRSTIAASAFNNYSELTVATAGSASDVGFAVGDKDAWIITGGGSYLVYRESGAIVRFPGNTSVATVASFGQGDVLGMAVDDTNVKFYKNGSLQGTYAHQLTGDYFVTVMNIANNNNTVVDVNFGQRPFTHTLPSNYKALCTQNLDDPLIEDPSNHFDVDLWSGDNADPRQRTLSMSPDLVWIKTRNQTNWHSLTDSVRGAPYKLYANSTNAEDTTPQYGQIDSLNSNGFTLGGGTDSSNPLSDSNQSGTNYVAWAWEGGDLVTNSSYNQSNTWSSSSYFTSTTGFRSSEPATNAFDGSTSTICSAVNNGVVTFTSPVTFSSSSTIKVFVHGGDHTVTVNGGSNQTVSAGSLQTITFSNPSASTFTMTFQRNGSADTGIRAIEIGGKLLVDPGIMPAGSLNSSLYDQSTTWSDLMSGHYQNATSAFDANGTTYAEANSGATIEIDLSNNSITATSRLQVMNDPGFTGSTDVQYKIYTTSSSTPAFTKTIGGTQSFDEASSNWSSAAITKITVRGLNEGARISKVIYDGKTLVNDTTTPPNIPSIATTVRANPTAGFSICSYTGNGTSGETVSHGLNGAVPKMVIMKNRDSASTDWRVYNTMADGSLDILYLNSTVNKNNSSLATHTGNVFTVGSSASTNENNSKFIAYCFAPVEGYSAFGSYTGNGSSNGPFVYTGMRPRWVLIKHTNDSGNNWIIYDSERNTSNVMGKQLYPNSNAAEADATQSTHARVDFLSNGFKVRGSHSSFNTNNANMIYAAFAESPLKYARAR